MKLSVHLVTWNGAKYIPFLFESLRKQTYKDWELLVIDNGSSDGTVELIRKELENFERPWQIIENQKNLGFAGGHNQAIRETCRVGPGLAPGRPGMNPRTDGGAQGPALQVSNNDNSSDYIQLLNQDMYLTPDYFEKVVAMMEAHPEAGAGQGMLLRWDFSNESGKTDMIDTMGLKVFRSRRVVDLKTGEKATSYLPTLPTGRQAGQAGKLQATSFPIEVFGVSGALPIYRRKAIEEVMFEGQTRQNFLKKNFGGQVFDEDFFMYKEDVDLAFRLRSTGWRAYIEPQARAWHDRTAAGPRETSDHAALQNRKSKSDFVNHHSYKNHLFVLIKNEYLANLLQDWPWIVSYELKKFIYLLLFERQTLKSLKDFWRLLPRMLKKRRTITAKRKLFAREIRQWYV